MSLSSLFAVSPRSTLVTSRRSKSVRSTALDSPVDFELGGRESSGSSSSFEGSKGKEEGGLGIGGNGESPVLSNVEESDSDDCAAVANGGESSSAESESSPRGGGDAGSQDSAEVSRRGGGGPKSASRSTLLHHFGSEGAEKSGNSKRGTADEQASGSEHKRRRSSLPRSSYPQTHDPTLQKTWQVRSTSALSKTFPPLDALENEINDLLLKDKRSSSPGYVSVNACMGRGSEEGDCGMHMMVFGKDEVSCKLS